MVAYTREKAMEEGSGVYSKGTLLCHRLYVHNCSNRIGKEQRT